MTTAAKGYRIDRQDGLTARERQVLSGIAIGQTLKQIADEIGVTKQRVDLIVKALIRKDRLSRDGNQFEIRVPR